MADKEITNVTELMDQLGVEDTRDITEEKVQKFIDMIPAVDKEVAIEFIKVLPPSLQATAQITEQLRLLVSNGLSSSDASTNACMKGYQTVLDSMAEAQKDGNYSFDEQKEIWDKMINVASEMDKKDAENKEFISKTIKTVRGIIGGVLLLGVAIIGANSLGDKNKN